MQIDDSPDFDATTRDGAAAPETTGRRLILIPLFSFLALLLVVLSCATTSVPTGSPSDSISSGGSAASWIAGDHHIHSRFSVGWNQTTDPPSPIIGGDAIYPIPMNALMARRFGLSWMVATDHGGPNHSKVNLEQAYPELVLSRELVPEVVQFYGMELNTPGADHSSLIIPHTHDEAQRLYELESSFDRQDAWPTDSSRDDEGRMIEALRLMDRLREKPVVIANHPSRSARADGTYGRYDPAEFRQWNDTAPEVAVGMAGAPGHQAATLFPDGALRPERSRGAYSRQRTMGGFDPMTARLGGLWDSMLGEGRRWWITANSDSHVHFSEGGADFWPGEYSKTYVWAERDHDAILSGLRSGKIFVATGDLIAELTLEARSGSRVTGIGGELVVGAGDEVFVEISVRDPSAKNANGDDPSVRRVDLILGEVTGPVADPAADRNATTRVLQRFGRREWRREGDTLEMTASLGEVTKNLYLRIRGTNTEEPEPEVDPAGEDPWSDLWFYSNPIFVKVR